MPGCWPCRWPPTVHGRPRSWLAGSPGALSWPWPVPTPPQQTMPPADGWPPPMPPSPGVLDCANAPSSTPAPPWSTWACAASWPPAATSPLLSGARLPPPTAAARCAPPPPASSPWLAQLFAPYPEGVITTEKLSSQIVTNARAGACEGQQHQRRNPCGCKNSQPSSTSTCPGW